MTDPTAGRNNKAIVGLGPDNTLQDHIEDENITDAHTQAATTITVDSTTLAGAAADAQAEFELLDDADAVAATTSVVGHVQLSDATNETSSTKAATPTAVKAAYDNGATAANAAVVDHNDNLGSSPYPHAFKALKKALVAGANETACVDEIQTITLTAGAEGDTFKLTFNANESNAVVIPAGGYVNVTAAQIKAALITISDWVTKGADIAVTKNVNDYAVAFSGTLGRSDIGAITVTSKTGAADGSVAETLKGVAGTQLTVAGADIGDLLSDVVVFTTAAAIATAVVRASTDFRIAEAGKVDVIANVVDNTNNQYLVEYIDLT